MNESNIDVMFVELVYTANLPQFSHLKKYFLEKLLETEKRSLGQREVSWYCNTYSTLASKEYNLLEDQMFSSLGDEILKHCKLFSKEFGVNKKDPYFTDAWMNLSHPGDYQEFHIHPVTHFSAIFYVDVPENSGRTVFKNTITDHMYPAPADTATQAGSTSWVYEPVENDLVLFRSHIHHMVEINKSNEDRITISANICLPY